VDIKLGIEHGVHFNAWTAFLALERHEDKNASATFFKHEKAIMLQRFEQVAELKFRIIQYMG